MSELVVVAVADLSWTTKFIQLHSSLEQDVDAGCGGLFLLLRLACLA